MPRHTRNWNVMDGLVAYEQRRAEAEAALHDLSVHLLHGALTLLAQDLGVQEQDHGDA